MHASARAAILALGLLAVLIGACRSETTPDQTVEPASERAGSLTQEPGGAATTVDATLSEFAIDLSQSSAPAGLATFAATNDGAVEHELVVVRSDAALDELPAADGIVDESELDIVGEVEEFPAGETREQTFDLEPGRYVLLCNLPGHYEAGMRTEFTVQ